MYLWNGRVHVGKTRKALGLNTGRGGMKWLMEEAATGHAEAVHYSASTGIWVGGDDSLKLKDSGFWPLVLEGLSRIRLRKEEADCAKKQVWEVTGWNEPIEEKTSFVEVAC